MRPTRPRDILKQALDAIAPFKIHTVTKGKHKGSYELYKIIGANRTELVHRYKSRNIAERELAHAQFEWRLDNAGIEMVVLAKQEKLL